MRDLSWAEIARLRGIGKATAERWVKLALSYEVAAADGLRKLAKRRARSEADRP